MKKAIRKSLLLVGIVALSCEFANAAIITQWSFNSTNAALMNSNTNYGPNYSNPGTPNSPTPSTGSGTAITLGMTNPYNGGSIAADDILSTNGTANPTASEWLWRVRATTAFAFPSSGTLSNSNILPNGNVSTNGWANYNISNGTAHDGAPQYTQGVELDTSTVGYSNVQFSFDWYSTTQGIRDLQFQYNLNTSNTAGWTNIGADIGSPAGAILNQSSGTAQNYVFVATPNDFYGGAEPRTITVNLSSLSGASNDPNFGVRLVAAFDDTNKYQDYVSASLNAGQTQLYNNSSGNWRLGNLTFVGALSLNTSSTGPQLTWNSGSGMWDTVSSNSVWLDSGSSSVAFANGSAAAFGNVSSGTSTIAVAAGGVVPSGIAINNTTPGTGYVFAGGAISGTGAMYLQSTNVGFVSLSGTNTYTGGTQVSGGTLIVAGDRSLGAAGSGAGGAAVVDNGATLQLASNLASGRLFEIGDNGGGLDTQGLSFSTSGSFLTGGSYRQLGSGTVSLSGASVQLSGSTTIAAGAVVFSGTSGASLQGGGTFNGNLVVSQPERVNFDNGGTSGLYGGSGQIQVTFAGSGGTKASNASNAWVVLADSATGTSTSANGTVVSGGTISNNVVLNSNNQAFNKSDVTNTFAFPASGEFVVGIGATTPGNVIAFTGNISGSSDVVLGSNSINGAGGAGTLFLSGSNSWAGTTIIAGNGIIQLGSTAALPQKTDVIFGATDNTSATLDLNGFNQTINSLSAAGGAGTITNSSSSSVTLTVSGSITPKTAYNGAITGNLALYKDGTGKLLLSGSSTYTGATTIARGSVTVSNTSALGVGPLSVQNGGTLVYSGALVSLGNTAASVASGASVNTGGTANFGALAMNNLSLSGGSVTYDFNTTQSNLVTGTGVLDLAGASPNSVVVNLNMSGQSFNTYPLFQFGGVNGFNASDFTVGSGTQAGYTYGFVQNGSGEIDLTITGTGSNNLPTRQPLTWATNSANWNTSDVNWASSGGTAIFVNGDPVTFGEPTANNSVVTISDSAVTPLSLTFSNSSNSYTVTGGSIAGTTSLVKTGAGLLTLSNSNTYGGGTFVNGGTLATGAAGNAALGATSGGVTLDTNGTLQFTTSNFSSARNIAVNAGGGTIVASSGTATVSGNLTVAANGTFSKAGSAVLNLTGNLSSGTGSAITVSTGTLALIPENFTDGGQLTVLPSATLFMLTKTATRAASKAVTLGSTQIDGKVVITNPLTLQFSGLDISGTGSIQFQNMQTPAAQTHFTIASAQGIAMTNVGPFVTQNINCNIQLNSLNAPFFKTSISQSGAQANGNGFILGNGTADSFFYVYPGSGNIVNFNGAISGNCDVQFGQVGGGGAANTIYLNNQNTYTGVTMFEQGVSGVVIFGASNALPTTTDLIFAPVNGNSYQQTLDLNGNNQSVASISYWASANTDSHGNGYSNAIQVVNSNPSSIATLTVSGAQSPSRPFGGVLGDTGNHNLVLVKDGPNTLWLNGNFNSYTGGTTVKNGLLLLSPSDPIGGTPTGFGDVTVNGGTLQGTATIQGNLIVVGSGAVHPGLANSLVSGGLPGTLGVANNATVSGGATFQYDFGLSHSSLLNVANALTLPTTGSATINLNDAGGLSGIVPLMTYGMLGNSFSTSQLTVGTSPDGASAYAFRSTGSTAASGEVDLIAPSKLTWTGSFGSAWDTNNTTNFSAINDSEASVFNANLAAYGVKDHVTFNDTGSGGTVAIASVGVAPQSVVFGNLAKSYDLTGGPIAGSTSLVLSGGGHLTLDNANTYTGGTFVNSGTLIVDNASAIANGTNLTVGSSAPFQAPIVPDGIAGASVAAVPEPGTLALLAAGIAFVAFRAAHRRKQ